MHTQRIRTYVQVLYYNIIVFHDMLANMQPKKKENLSKVDQVTKSSEDPAGSSTTATEDDEAHLLQHQIQSLRQQVEVSMHCIVSELDSEIDRLCVCMCILLCCTMLSILDYCA